MNLEPNKRFCAPEQETDPANNNPSTDIYQLGMLWAMLIKNSSPAMIKKGESFSSILGNHWNTLISSMLCHNASSRPQITQVIESLVQIDEFYREAMSMPFKPDVS
jgi:serine/threonine protein kinase